MPLYWRRPPLTTGESPTARIINFSNAEVAFTGHAAAGIPPRETSGDVRGGGNAIANGPLANRSPFSAEYHVTHV